MMMILAQVDHDAVGAPRVTVYTVPVQGPGRPADRRPPAPLTARAADTRTGGDATHW